MHGKHERSVTRTRIFSFGCPRSGTTFVQDVLCRLDVGGDVIYQKIAEGDQLHPCQSKDGLLGLAQLYRSDHVVFVRSVRKPTAILESFLAARKIASESGRIERIAANSDERIFRFIKDERDHVRYQTQRHAQMKRKAAKAGRQFWPFQVVTFDYDRMHDPTARAYFMSNVLDLMHSSDVYALNRAGRILDTFGQRSGAVRTGRLSEGITEPLATPAQLEALARFLKS